jgi:GNAT superfamily N-acetyltransferase
MARYVFFSDAPFLVGYALYFYTYSTWDGRVLYMEDLYVKPEFRGNKIGTQLWKAVTKVTVFPANKPVYYDIANILLKLALNIHNLILRTFQYSFFWSLC